MLWAYICDYRDKVWPYTIVGIAHAMSSAIIGIRRGPSYTIVGIMRATVTIIGIRRGCTFASRPITNNSESNEADERQIRLVGYSPNN